MNEPNKLLEDEKIIEIAIYYEEKGKEIGEEIGYRKVALNMLKKNIDLNFIAEVTNLEIHDVKKLQKHCI
ncbi:hypothetical protein GCM10022410_02820 [Amphibacillus indicireducens]|uniref:Transposase n=1 Tax=Amphibacillus indicireducens TaxID=1076330 RepID=A0ABP7V4L0_9BACI